MLYKNLIQTYFSRIENRPVHFRDLDKSQKAHFLKNFPSVLPKSVSETRGCAVLFNSEEFTSILQQYSHFVYNLFAYPFVTYFDTASESLFSTYEAQLVQLSNIKAALHVSAREDINCAPSQVSPINGKPCYVYKMDANFNMRNLIKISFCQLSNLIFNLLNTYDPIVDYRFPFKHAALNGPNQHFSVINFQPFASDEDALQALENFFQGGRVHPSLFSYECDHSVPVHSGMKDICQEFSDLSPKGKYVTCVQRKSPCIGLTTAIYFALSKLNNVVCYQLEKFVSDTPDKVYESLIYINSVVLFCKDLPLNNVHKLMNTLSQRHFQFFHLVYIGNKLPALKERMFRYKKYTYEMNLYRDNFISTLNKRCDQLNKKTRTTC
ncbi:hypothetical protein P9112_000725 [Eukaryota sp. TZLM1-RC]